MRLQSFEYLAFRKNNSIQISLYRTIVLFKLIKFLIYVCFQYKAKHNKLNVSGYYNQSLKMNIYFLKIQQIILRRVYLFVFCNLLYFVFVLISYRLLKLLVTVICKNESTSFEENGIHICHWNMPGWQDIVVFCVVYELIKCTHYICNTHVHTSPVTSNPVKGIKKMVLNFE